MDRSTHLRERVLALVAAMPSRSRRQTSRRQGVLLTLAMCLILGVASLHGLEPFLTKQRYLLGVLLFTSLGLTLGFSRHALSIGRASFGYRELARALERFLVPSLLSGVAGGAWIAPETVVWPELTVEAHLGCVVIELFVGALVIALSVSALLRIDPIAPADTAMTIGAVAGASLSLALCVACSHVDPTHTMLTHVAPVLLLRRGAQRFGARAVSVL
jgi:hypothetical protein